MTDRSDHDDEIVSAAIDGEATADEAARVASDPVLQARRATLESAAQALGTPVEPATAPARDAAIAAALAAFDAPGDDRGTEPEAAPVLGLRSRRPSPWVAVAAIALAVVAAGALLLRVRDTSTTSTAARRSLSSSSIQQYSASSGAGGAAAQSGQAGTTSGSAAGDSATRGAEAATAAPSAPAVAALGSFATVDDLTAAVRARLEPGATPAPASAAPFTCPPPAELASVQLVASATLGDRALLVFAGPTVAQGNPAYIAVDSACTKVLEQEL